MVKIRVLDAAVISKIAAGEVVERPFSVLKELVENSIDAGATRVVVELEEGGKSLLRVRDDGKGMSPEDLELAFVQHATSKLRDVEDLDCIASLGFRGEALASIGSVSRARIVSRERDAEHGFEVRADGGEISDVRPAAAAPGTVIEVRDLFVNVPARRRFLKTAAAERARCLDVLTRAALAHLDTGFVLEGRRGMDLSPGETLEQRVGKLFGSAYESQALAVEYEQGGIRVQGIALDPDAARRDRSQQYLFVNGRPFQDASLSHAIREAYREYLMPGKFPVVFLFLGLDPSRVDVNVHPTKAEVRFVEQRLVFSAVRRALLAALAARGRKVIGRADEQALEAPAGPEPVTGFPELPKGLFGDAPAVQGRFGERVGEHRDGARGGRVVASDGASAFSGAGSSGASTFDPAVSELAGDPAGDPAGYPAGDGTRDVGARDGEGAAEQARSARHVHANPFRPERRFLTIKDLYIIFETDDGFAIVDQHALHERVIYEKLLNAWRAGEVPVQRLLVPEVVELPPADKELLLEYREVLASAGIPLVDFGGVAVKLEGMPAAVRRADPQELVEGLVEELRSGEIPKEPEELLERFHSRACRTAIMAGDRLSDAEIESLLLAASELEHPHNCPHGRPTVVRWSEAQLERFFERTV